MTYTVLSHTADTGIEAAAETFDHLMEVMATGMFETMASVEENEMTHRIDLEVSASTREDLLVDVLSELLFKSEVEDLHFCSFEVTESAPLVLRVVAKGVPIKDIEPSGPPIKAVTYHDVTVIESEEGWFGRVYFDV